MRRISTLFAAGVLVLSACGGDSGKLKDAEAKVVELQSALGKAEAERDQAAARAADAEASAKAALADADAKAAEATKAAAERDAALVDRDKAAGEAATAHDDAAAADAARKTAEQALADSERAVGDLLRSYDPEIKAAIEQAKKTANDEVCSAADAAGYAGEPMPGIGPVLESLLASIPPAATKDISVRDLFDAATLEARLAECFGVGSDRRDAELLAEKLDAPFGDGFYTVGLEVGAGKWRSDGDSDTCYWQISPDGNPDRILSNHFGLAGGTVTLKDGQEFQTDDCGTWTKVG